jgi:hypothetical protein
LTTIFPSPPPVGDPTPEVQSNALAALRRRRRELADQVLELHWDLGGLAYEMAIRDHFRLDVLVRRAALLQERDAELAEVERLLRLEEGASVGACPACAAPHSRGAVFCWQCGATLMERAPSSAVPALGADQPGVAGQLDAVGRPATTGQSVAAGQSEAMSRPALAGEPHASEQDTVVIQ